MSPISILWSGVTGIKTHAFLVACHNSKSQHWGGYNIFCAQINPKQLSVLSYNNEAENSFLFFFILDINQVSGGMREHCSGHQNFGR
jgi:hypothetical protein